MTDSEKAGNGLVTRLAVTSILFYRHFLSPLFPPSCRYAPTCSQYALEAITLHGVGKGLFLALRRILRCHPFTWLGGSSGFDPVPHRCSTGRHGQ